MDFSFLKEAVKTHPKILNNIGILNFYFETGDKS